MTIPADVRTARRWPGRGGIVVGVLLGWLVLGALLRGRWTLALAPSDLSASHRRLNDLKDWVDAQRGHNPVFGALVTGIRVAVDHLVVFVQHLIAQPPAGRGAPVIGWLGVVALAGLLAAVVGTFRVALLAVAGLTFVGLQGLWQESMDTLALTLAAVLLCLLIGLPLGIAAGVSDGVRRAVTPVLDLMQTMPTFVYLAPLTLFFQIGPASAAITTVLFAAPPTIRYTAHGIRQVPAATVEAAILAGSTRWQRLLRVELPLARGMIVLGINQTIMAALAMVTIAALIDAPGLGKTVLQALETLDVGTAFNAGLAMVVLAVLLDRITTAAGRRLDPAQVRRPASVWRRRAVLAVGAGLTAFAVYLSHTYLWAAQFPDQVTVGGRPRALEIGTAIAGAADAVTGWITDHLSGLTGGLKDLVTSLVVDPLQALLAESPWWLVTGVVVALAAVLGDRVAALSAAGCLGLLVASGLWQDSMITLASTLVATVLVLLIGVLVGVWMGRGPRADRLVRPVLDAAQTMPAFVYLVPFVALFAASRFTAILAGVVYAAPVAVKVVADGVSTVPRAAVEAATAAGSTTWQTITKVQLPMARESLALAVNQGLIYVLSMIVVGGLVGAGALGYDVVAGFEQGSRYGKGLAAGLAIVVLGIMLDRITQAAARRARA